ncbi:hypothetical protein [Pedobacter gandavensis]|uniref:hypothetical protein n=1 Tax=Pedobacter gandavensis TaxID=2679963 RepID=UPI002931D4B8|nr:hypothetical protein [Pedobacter gandavensis]
MTDQQNQWTLVQKTGFRFIFLLFLLFIIFFNNGVTPLLIRLFQYPMELFKEFVPWFAKQYLNTAHEATFHFSGSGDTTFAYVSLLIITLFSLIGTFIWSIADQKSKNYNQLYYWLTVALRFYVGIMLLNYGLVKFTKTQFPYPDLLLLTQNYGANRPMGLAWGFFGYSNGYNIFVGFAEVLAVLLFFRRTTTIGAFLTLMTAANIMMVNYLYGVPVKIVSTALFLFCLFLLAPNFGTLTDFFLKGKAAALKMLDAPEIKKKWLYYTKYTVKYLFILMSVIGLALQAQERDKYYSNNPKKTPLYGAYRISSFSKPKDARPTEKNWKFLLIGGDNDSGIRYLNDEYEPAKIKIDTLNKKIEIVFEREESKHNFSYTKPSEDRLILNGKLYTESVSIELTREKFPLVTKEFQWIIE